MRITLGLFDIRMRSVSSVRLSCQRCGGVRRSGCRAQRFGFVVKTRADRERDAPTVPLVFPPGPNSALSAESDRRRRDALIQMGRPASYKLVLEVAQTRP
jgi:hypothetical protein